MQLQNDLILRVARGEQVERPPVWLMRQAGRFLHEYRAVRAEAGSFRAMIANPAYAAEVTLQPVDILGVDAAIIFSDILVIPEAMGLPYEMAAGEGPVFPKTVRRTDELSQLHPVAEKSNLDDTYQAIRLVKQQLAGRVPLIGFAGAPWTIFCYMVEGGSSKSYGTARGILYSDPAFAHALLTRITDATITYLRGQIAAGVDIVQVFDSWAALLGPKEYAEFAMPYLHAICAAITEVPVIVFPKGANQSLHLLASLPCAVIGIDWTTPPAEARAKGVTQALQGNLDPSLLYASPARVEAAAREMLASFEPGRHIANLGHGIYPDLPREHVQAFVETVKSYRYAEVTAAI